MSKRRRKTENTHQIVWRNPDAEPCDISLQCACGTTFRNKGIGAEPSWQQHRDSLENR